MERERLKRLIETGLLDTSPEDRFDRLTRLASNAFEAPIALISLIDSDRQWFKSKVGMDVDETARDIALCNQTISDPDDLFVVLDAQADDRFNTNPLVTGTPNVAFYAGAPLVTSDGYAIGSLCVIDSKPRGDFSSGDREILKDLAASVMGEIETAARDQRTEDLDLANQELQHRFGNVYAQMSGLIAVLAKSENDVVSFKRNVAESIQSMAQMQALLAANRYRPISFTDLFDGVIAPYRSMQESSQIELENTGNLLVSERAAFLMTLMLGELATNSAKHGAFSRADGQVRVFVTSGDEVQFEWKESWTEPSEKSQASQREGFGSRLLSKIIPSGLKGQSQLSIEAHGMSYRLSADPAVFLE